MLQASPSPNKLWYLTHIRLFDGLSQAEMQELERLTRMQAVKKRQPLYLTGEPSTNVYLLKQGRIKLTKTSPSGKEVTFEILGPGDILGELEVLDESPRLTSAEALDDALLCVMPREAFTQFLARHPAVTVTLTKLIGLRLRKLQSRVEDLVFRDVPARLAHFLLELSKTYGVSDGTSIRLRVKLTHQELANLIGCSRETVSTTLGQFREQGLIRTEDRAIVILKPDHLTQLVSSQ
jgi:CRP-like cAMP-binding protein